VTPSLHIDYKHCQIKQYHKHGRALRTETTINDCGCPKLCALPVTCSFARAMCQA
jgi:hypothetical protein